MNVWIFILHLASILFGSITLLETKGLTVKNRKLEAQPVCIRKIVLADLIITLVFTAIHGMEVIKGASFDDSVDGYLVLFIISAITIVNTCLAINTILIALGIRQQIKHYGFAQRWVFNLVFVHVLISALIFILTVDTYLLV